MTPQEALQILDQLAASAQLNRQSHIAAQEAVQTIRKALVDLQKDGAAAPVEMPAEEATT